MQKLASSPRTHHPHSGAQTPPPHRTATTSRRRASALLLASVVAGSAFVAVAEAASALVPADGTVVVAGFPAAYKDANNLSLQPCLDDARCAGPVDTTPPDGEFFYNLMEGEVALDGLGASGGTMRVIIGLEGAFADPGGTPEVFSRIRFVARDAAPNTTYTIDHPYGDDAVVETDGRGRGRFSEDTICGAPPAACGPANFITAVGASPAGFVGNGATEQAITGGKRDFVSVSSGSSTVTQRAFIVMGQVAAGTTTPPPTNPPPPGTTAPAAPAAPSARQGRSGGPVTAFVNWAAPSNNGGSAITGYTVEAHGASASAVDKTMTVGAGSTSFEMPLVAGRYRFSVRATNSAGTSGASGLSNVARAR